jgi:site-specific DNA recombinase
MQNEKQYVPPFVRHVMKDSTDQEIQEATENLRRYLMALYGMFLRAQTEKPRCDSSDFPNHDRFETGSSLRATPSTSPSMNRYFAYIRVSTAKQGQHGSSLQEQRDAIVAFAQRQGFAIIEWFEDRETAAKTGRTQFTRMMSQLEKHKASGVLLHKIDRGARNLYDWARIQRLQDTGVEVHVVHDHFDMTSRGGRLAADIQAVAAADFIRNLRDETHKALNGRLKQGLYPFRAPRGYLDQGPGKPKVIDPITGPLIKLAFELYASRRYSLGTLRAELQKRGLARTGGSALHANSVANILHNSFYAGVISVKSSGETFAGVHEPLIRVALFKRVQEVLKSKNIETVQRHDFLFRRLLRCKHCNTTLIGERQKGIAYYRCHTRGCLTKCIREDSVWKQFFAAIACLRFADHEVEEMLPLLNQADVDETKALEAAARSARLRVSATIEREARLKDAYIEQVISRPEYETRKAAVHLELAEAREILGKMEHSVRGFALTVERFFKFVRQLTYEQSLRDAPGFRETVREATLNWVVDRKNLCITMRSPFQELSHDLAIFYGVPSQGRDRTPERRVECAKMLRKHLRTWRPPSWIISEEQRKAPPPAWKKNLLNQRDDDDFKQAA